MTTDPCCSPPKSKGGGNAEAEVAYLRNKAERREAEKRRQEAERHNRNQDRVIALNEAESFAEWLFHRVDSAEFDRLISWLEGTRDAGRAARRSGWKAWCPSEPTAAIERPFP
jgi:hypothetical protein